MFLAATQKSAWTCYPPHAYSEVFVFVIPFLCLKLLEGVGKASVDQVLPDGVVQSSDSSSHL